MSPTITGGELDPGGVFGSSSHARQAVLQIDDAVVAERRLIGSPGLRIERDELKARA